MLFSGYICNDTLSNKCFVGNHVCIKKLLIRALTKSPGVSTSGLSFFGAGLRPARASHALTLMSVIATLTHAAYHHFHLLGYISSRKVDGWDSDAFKTYRSTAYVANKVNVVVMVLSTGTVVFA